MECSYSYSLSESIVDDASPLFPTDMDEVILAMNSGLRCAMSQDQKFEIDCPSPPPLAGLSRSGSSSS
jgi:hypothetical protein